MYFAHPIDFFALPILKKKVWIYQIWFLFGIVPVSILIRGHIGPINNNSKMSSTNAKFIVICKPQTLNDGGEDSSVQYRNRKKHCFLAAAAIFLFIGKIIITS